jgi:hypothetical protein
MRLGAAPNLVFATTSVPFVLDDHWFDVCEFDTELAVVYTAPCEDVDAARISVPVKAEMIMRGF